MDSEKKDELMDIEVVDHSWSEPFAPNPEPGTYVIERGYFEFPLPMPIESVVGIELRC